MPGKSCAGSGARICPECSFHRGVFPFKRENEDPTRMFEGEGYVCTNRVFHLLSKDMPAKRLSTDSTRDAVGFDPDERPDIYGKSAFRRLDRGR